MKKRGAPADSLNRLWNFFASVRLTVIILLSLAATSIIGTLIPQNESPVAYYREYGEFLYRIFSVLSMFDMYHSWWFQLLILLLVINVVVCSIDRLSATWKIVFVKIPQFTVSRFRSLSDNEEFNANRSPEKLLKIYEPVVSKHFGYTRIEHTDKGFCIFAEKGRWTRLGVYAVHLSVIFMLFGALIGSIFGFEGFVNIPEGKAVENIRLRNAGKMQKLNFKIRCDDFNVSFYDTGAPKEYRSSLTILEHEKPVFKKDIIVNDPIRYKGINIFQSSYGKLPPKRLPPKDLSSLKEISLNFKSRKTGMTYKKKAKIGQPFDIPEGIGKFVITDFRDSADFRGQNIGQALIGILTPSDGNPVKVLLPLRFPNFDKMRRGDMVISVADQKGQLTIPMADRNDRYYTGLQVTKDPGVPLVYTGFVMMIIGCFITFFMSHQKICIEVIKKEEKSRVMVAGTANKNKLGIQKKIKKIAQGLVNLENRKHFSR